MSNRNRIHKSSIHRRRGPTHTHDYPVEGGKKRRAEDGIVSPRYGRRMDWVEEKDNLEENRDYGSGTRSEDIEQNRYAPRIGRKRLGDGDYYRESYWDAEEFREGRPPHNNYDDYDRIYPPSQGR